jgi:hypothetical protein
MRNPNSRTRSNRWTLFAAALCTLTLPAGTAANPALRLTFG